MSNEELALQIRAGKRDRLMELWAQVRRFALQQARRWAYLGRGGVTLEDLEQSAFLALLDALEGWRAEAGQFLTWYGLRLKAAFTEATGQRTQRDRLDPLDRALSLEAPVGDEDDTLTLADVIPDPQAAEARSMGYASQGRGGASRGAERGNPAAVLDEPDHGGNLGGYRRTGEGGAQAGGGSPAGAASPQGVQNVAGLSVKP